MTDRPRIASAGRSRRGNALLDLDVDLLDLGERLEGTLDGELAPDAAGLVAAVGLADDLAAALVDLNPAGLDPVRGVQRIGQVVRPDVGAEPVMRIVGHRDHLVAIAPGNGDQHRPEDFLLGNAPGVVDAGENGRPGVEAVQIPRRRIRCRRAGPSLLAATFRPRYSRAPTRTASR